MRGRGVFLVLGVVVLLLTVACSRTSGPQVDVRDVWARPTAGEMGGMSMGESHGGMEMGGKVTSAVYMTLVNRGTAPDRLIGVQTDVAEVAEIHESYQEGDVMKMRPVEGGLEIPAGGQVELRPGGYHIMLIGVRRELKPGDTFTLTLQFEKSGERQVTVEVRTQ